jgi:hypothetical protein
VRAGRAGEREGFRFLLAQRPHGAGIAERTWGLSITGSPTWIRTRHLLFTTKGREVLTTTGSVEIKTWAYFTRKLCGPQLRAAYVRDSNEAIGLSYGPRASRAC